MGSQVSLVCGTLWFNTTVPLKWCSEAEDAPGSTAHMGGGLAPIDNRHPPDSGTCTKRSMMASATSGSLLCMQSQHAAGSDSSCWSPKPPSPRHGLPHWLGGNVAMWWHLGPAQCTKIAMRTAGLEHTGLLPTVLAPQNDGNPPVSKDFDPFCVPNLIPDSGLSRVQPDACTEAVCGVGRHNMHVVKEASKCSEPSPDPNESGW